MRRPTNRTLAFLAAGAIAVGGAGAAIGVASSGGTSHDQALADALNRDNGTHLTAADVQKAEQEAFKAQLDAAVKAGQITQAQADRLLQRMQDAPQLRARHEAVEAARLAPVAKVLGLSVDALHTKLESGMSLAQVAKQQHVSRSALLAAIKEGIVAAGKQLGITFSAARLDQMAARIADGTFGPRGLGGWGGRHGWFGPGPGGFGGPGFGPFGG